MRPRKFLCLVVFCTNETKPKCPQISILSRDKRYFYLFIYFIFLSIEKNSKENRIRDNYLLNCRDNFEIKLLI
jgi:hypothetical protein